MERNRLDEKKTRAPSGAAVPSAVLTEQLYRAFLEEWAERGFAALSLERVAARAGAGKAAIYRRFPSKLAFADAVLDALGPSVALPEDTGALESDVLSFLLRLRAVLRHPLVRRILPDLHAEAARSKEMRAINTRVAAARRDLGRALLDRAVARGDLPHSLDREHALDLLPATLYWRMVVIGRTPSTKELRTIASSLSAALRRL
ncbi:TetR-like C-terminal domain-containing protein [Acidocella aminolytica]|uniref:Transcriptional regulator TetR n=1 Tax=Acidocella aminolytica 101 = DSM 11237 TaxID=1120923 RepID=A0A0D6PIB2_9PROT|nr:TetR-like C-terminal domain-containing protein [Acidocella aminolytica]GAN81520.1 transcriptional regulator TetR [Acidocella aminolytica 101 = DSM 11237]GBQ33100.1 TetR family transcriptional regulator [Acidocella aminolytica 101 = DSM 11237]SHF56434.1 transcriptional regulator, TetR family [Acidocella aminolytica 101 = DSM 11237]